MCYIVIHEMYEKFLEKFFLRKLLTKKNVPESAKH